MSSDAEPHRQAQSLPAEPRSVLIVEDEHLVAMHLQKTLSELGLNIVGPAPNAERALRLARDEKPDLAIVDIRLPGDDGLSVANELFAKHAIPVIILSAFSDPRYVEQTNLAGVFGYLLKPAMLDDLRVNLAVAWNRFVEHAQLRDEVRALRGRLGEPG